MRPAASRWPNTSKLIAQYFDSNQGARPAVQGGFGAPSQGGFGRGNREEKLAVVPNSLKAGNPTNRKEQFETEIIRKLTFALLPQISF